MTTSSESLRDKIARVRGMANGGDIWDLSDNDQAALKAVLDIREELLTALKHARTVLHSCAIDTTGTPTQKFFEDQVRMCDTVISKAEGRV